MTIFILWFFFPLRHNNNNSINASISKWSVIYRFIDARVENYWKAVEFWNSITLNKDESKKHPNTLQFYIKRKENENNNILLQIEMENCQLYFPMLFKLTRISCPFEFRKSFSFAYKFFFWKLILLIVNTPLIFIRNAADCVSVRCLCVVC